VPEATDPDRRLCVDCGERRAVRHVERCDRCYARAWRWSRRHKQHHCTVCDALFETTRADARFCSVACRQRASRRRQAGRPIADPPAVRQQTARQWQQAVLAALAGNDAPMNAFMAAIDRGEIERWWD
jgi:hypothetical protein